MKTSIYPLFAISLLMSASVTAAVPTGDAERGKTKAFSCQFCHGADGKASRAGYPHVNGQNEQYLFNSMKSYQNGLRTGTYAEMMTKQLSMMNDQDLADIAAFYSQAGKQ